MRLIELINERAEIEKLLRDMTRRPGAFWSSTPKGMSGYLAKAHDQTRKMMHAEARADRAAALKTIRSQSEEAPEFSSGLRRLLDRHIHLSRMIQDAYASIRLDDGMPLQEALCRQAALKELCHAFVAGWRELLSAPDIFHDYRPAITPKRFRRITNPWHKEYRLLSVRIHRALHGATVDR